MSLEEKLAAMREAAAKRIPPERLAIMHDATERLRQSGILDRVIKPGARRPTSPSTIRTAIRSYAVGAAARGPVLMSVFRGFW